MTKSTNKRCQPSIAYIRVSTDKQGQSGYGLEAQKVTINEFARRERYEIGCWFEDIASACGAKSIEKRDGLMSAIEASKTMGVPILVYDGSRVSRVTDQLLSLVGNEKIKIISVTEGAMAGSILASSAKRSQYEREIISTTTKESLQRLKAKGTKLGNRTNLPEAQRKGVETNRKRADEIVSKIADVIDEIGDNDQKAGEWVQILNQRGIKTGQLNDWTLGSIRRPLREAKKLSGERSRLHYKNDPLYGRF